MTENYVSSRNDEIGALVEAAVFAYDWRESTVENALELILALAPVPA